MSKKYIIPESLAKKVVEILHDITGDNVNVMDQNGRIIATKQKHRLGRIHEGAKKIVEGEADFVAITEKEAVNMKGVMPGYNGPIEIDGERIGCIGITGKPEEVKPLQKLASIIVTNEIKKNYEMKQERAIVNKIALKIKKAYAAISKVSNGADEIAETGKYMERVSKDVRKLSVESSNSLKNITTVLVEIKDAVSKIAQGIYKNAEHTSNQANALKEIEDSISNIQLELDKFYKNRRQSYY